MSVLSREAIKRIHSDIIEAKALTNCGIFFVQDDNKCSDIDAVIFGPDDTPYEGGIFHFHLQFPNDYPWNPPHVQIMTTGGGTVRFNPNLYKCGKVCLSILGTW
jgi:ubiquitin-conjugating enzyme E2 Z